MSAVLVSPTEYAQASFTDSSAANKYQSEMDAAGWTMYDINVKRSGGYFSAFAYKRQMPCDVNGFTDDAWHAEREMNVLIYAKHLQSTSEQLDLDTYKYAESIIYNRGWINDDFFPTEAGLKAMEAYVAAKTV